MKTQFTSRLMGCTCAIALIVLWVAPAWAGGAQGPTTRAMLDQLNQETTALYHQVHTGIYRVQLPQPKWLNDYAMAAITRWDKKLDPQMRKQLQEQHAAPLEAVIEASSAPGTEHAGASAAKKGAFIIIRPQPIAVADNDPALGGVLQLEQAKPQPGFDPNNIGVLLDADGHVLVPLYVERETVGEQPIKVAGPDATVVDARFVGSDRQTNLTVVQVEKPAGRPVTLSTGSPAIGSLVLCLSPVDGSGRLGIWTENGRDNGILVNTDGEIAGITRSGQLLGGSACKLIARQLIDFGAVKRATLGVLITEVPLDAAARRQQGASSARSAMRIDQVIKGSAADRGGLQAGDLILEVAGEPVGNIPGFAAAIAARAGETPLTLLRGNKTITLSVTLQQQK